MDMILLCYSYIVAIVVGRFFGVALYYSLQLECWLPLILLLLRWWHGWRAAAAGRFALQHQSKLEQTFPEGAYIHLAVMAAGPGSGPTDVALVVRFFFIAKRSGVKYGGR